MQEYVRQWFNLISNDDKILFVVNICFDLNCDNMEICRMNFKPSLDVDIMLRVLIALFREHTELCFTFSLSDILVFNKPSYSGCK